MNQKLLSFILKYGKRPESDLFLNSYHALNLPDDILGNEISLDDKIYIFIGIVYQDSSNVNLLNSLTNTNYIIKSNNYKAVLLQKNTDNIYNKWLYHPILQRYCYNAKLKELKIYININTLKELLSIN